MFFSEIALFNLRSLGIFKKENIRIIKSHVIQIKLSSINNDFQAIIVSLT